MGARLQEVVGGFAGIEKEGKQSPKAKKDLPKDLIRKTGKGNVKHSVVQNTLFRGLQF